MDATISIHYEYLKNKSQLPDQKDPQRLLTLAYGTLYAMAKDFHDSKAALQHARTRLDLLKAMTGTTVPSMWPLAIATNHVAHAMIYMGEQKAASELIERSIKIRKDLLNCSGAALYSPYVSLGIWNWVEWKYDEAARYLLVALADWEAEFGIDDQEGGR